MSFVTITEAAKLVSKSNQTLYRHVKSGKLSRQSDGTFETTELIRVYGSLSSPDTPQSINTTPTPLQRENGLIEVLQQQVTLLQSDLAELRVDVRKERADSKEREVRLMALLEHKIDTPQPDPVEKGGFFGKLFK